MTERRQFKRSVTSTQKWYLSRMLSLVKKGLLKNIMDKNRILLEEQLKKAKIKAQDLVEKYNLLETQKRFIDKEIHGNRTGCYKRRN